MLVKKREDRPILGFAPSKDSQVTTKLSNLGKNSKIRMHDYAWGWINPTSDARANLKSLIEDGFGHLNGVCFDFKSSPDSNMHRPWFFYIPMRNKRFKRFVSTLSELGSPTKVAFYKSVDDPEIIIQCFSTTSEVDILSPLSGLEIHVFDKVDGKYVEIQ